METPRSKGRVGFGLASILLHAAVVLALIGLIDLRAPRPVPDGAAVEMVFQEAEPPRPREDVAESVVEPAMPETPRLSPATEPPVEAAETQQPPTVAEPPAPSELVQPPKVAEPPPTPAPRLPGPVATVVQPVRKSARRRPVGRATPPLASLPSNSTPPPPVALPAVDPSWRSSVAGWLASRKAYPEEARRRGEEGRVTVRLTIDRSGRVLDAEVVGGSGSALLDAATVGLLRDASMPAFPPSMPQERITITTSISYSLR